MIRFRGAVRPVIIAGDRSFVERCIREGERNKDQLRQRGVSGGFGVQRLGRLLHVVASRLFRVCTAFYDSAERV